jgi:hypothetical protein
VEAEAGAGRTVAAEDQTRKEMMMNGVVSTGIFNIVFHA